MSSSLSVRRLSEGLVPPSEATPSITLPLSWLDRMPSNKAMKDTLLVFNHGQEPAKVIRQALSKALVPYYPLAGVFVVSHQAELQVLCNGDGIWFVEAVADSTLEDLNFLTDFPLMINQNDLLPQPLPGTDPTDRMFMMQVTQFKCGGFVIGTRGNHAMCDGLGSAQFIKAIADIAKGQEQLTIEPVWCRELLPTPQSLPQGPPPPEYTPELSSAFIKISTSDVNRMKHHIIHQLGRQCSTFDVLTAKIWRSRARAMHADPHVNLHLLLCMSIRHILPQVPPGFYGNCIHLTTLTMQSSKLVNEPLHELVKMIRDAKDGLPVDYFEWIKGNGKKVDTSSMGSGYESMAVTDWTRLGFLDTDFGWGSPSHFLPVVSYNQKFASCLILRAPASEQGFRVIAQCVKKEDFGLFHDEMMNFKLGDAETNHGNVGDQNSGSS